MSNEGLTLLFLHWFPQCQSQQLIYSTNHPFYSQRRMCGSLHRLQPLGQRGRLCLKSAFVTLKKIMFEVWPLSFTLLIKPSGLACLPCKAHVLPLCLTLSSPCLRSPWLPSIVCSPVTMPTLHCVENGPKALSRGFMGDVVGGIVLWVIFFHLFVFDPCCCCVYFAFFLDQILVLIR